MAVGVCARTAIGETVPALVGKGISEVVLSQGRVDGGVGDLYMQDNAGKIGDIARPKQVGFQQVYTTNPLQKEYTIPKICQLHNWQSATKDLRREKGDGGSDSMKADLSLPLTTIWGRHHAQVGKLHAIYDACAAEAFEGRGGMSRDRDSILANQEWSSA